MVNKNGNPQNFTKTKGRLKDLPATERQEIARKGAEKSNAVQKKNKDWADVTQMLLTHKASKGNIKKIKKLYPELDESKIDMMVTISTKVLSQASSGDIRSVEFLRDTAFGKPVQTIKQTNRNIDGAVIDDEGNQEA